MAPLVTPDFTERSPLLPGVYKAKIISCEQKTSQKGTPYLNWKFETQTENPATDRQWVYLSTTFSGKGAQIIKSLVKATVYPGYESGPVNTDELVSCMLKIHVDKSFNPDGTEGKYPQVVDVEPVDREAFDGFDGK